MDLSLAFAFALALAEGPAPEAPPPTTPPPLTYSEAYRQAVKEDKPLVVWVGGEFCPDCVRDSAADFVHVFVADFPGATAPAIVVALPEDGELVRIGDISWWITGDKTYGHVPSVRRAIANWRATRQRQVVAGPPVPTRSGQFRSVQPNFASPALFLPQAAPRMRGGRGAGACSS